MRPVGDAGKSELQQTAAQTVADARAEVEARRAQHREAREDRLRTAFAGVVPGRAVIAMSWTATAVLGVVSIATLVDADLIGPYFAVTFAMFCIGGVLLAVDVVLAIARSTRDAMGIGGLFFLADAAPIGVRRSLNGSVAVAVAISVVTAVVGLSTPELAFGTLAPLLQLSLSGLWGVRHGLFDPRGDGSDAR